MSIYSFVYLLVPLHLCYSNSVDYYVKPFLESKCPSGDQLCKTLDEYAKSTEDFQEGDIRLLFLAGIHNLTSNLNFRQLHSVQMIPAIPGTLVKIQLSCGDRIIDPATRFTIKKLTIFGAKRSSFILMDPHKVYIHRVNFSETSLILTTRSNHSHNMDVTVEDSFLEESSQTGLQINDKRVNVSGLLLLSVMNSHISHNRQGGIIIQSNAAAAFISITNSTVEENQLTPSNSLSTSAWVAVGLGIYFPPNESQVSISNTHFVHNEDLRGQPVVVDVSNVQVFEVLDSEFRHNRGTAIRATNVGPAGLILYGNIAFLDNTSLQGGALTLISTKVNFVPDVNITFENNHAEDVGGAIFVGTQSDSTLYDATNPHTRSDCFYWFASLTLGLLTNCSISFANNSAMNGGDHIYGAAMMSYCIASHNKVRSNDPGIQQVFHIDDDSISPISSNPSRVCVIKQNTSHSLTPSDSCADMNQIFLTWSAFPGEIFQIEAVLAGAEFGLGIGIIYAQFLPNPKSHPKLSQNQYLQRVPEPYIIQLNYSIFSYASHEVLVLAATGAKFLVNGNTSLIAQAVQMYEKTGIIPTILLTTPVYINVTISKCPLGFYHDQKSMGCTCNPKLCPFSNGTGLFNLRDNVWVNAYNKGDVSGIIMHHNCPFDYCNIKSLIGINLSKPDLQCAMSHRGILCGNCTSGLSLALGSNKCLPCSSDKHLALLIFFIVAGFLLVFFIKILNMTVSQGTINGLIFYANIMWAYQSIFFSHDEDTSVAELWFLKTFIAWINLDFGIEMCFVQGLTAYIKTWLQFVFPFYVWSIAGGMIFMAHYSEKMTRLFGNNSVQVLATLFLLSYTKLLRTTITALMPATLYVFTDNGEAIVSQTQVVWAFDGNLPYGRVPHIFLLVFAFLVLILLWLPFTIILLFIQPLRRRSDYWCFRLINKLKPLFDAYTGSLNNVNQFWVGLLLLARFVLLLTFTLTYSSDPHKSILALVLTILLLFTVLSYTVQLYDKPTKFSVHCLPEKVSFRTILEISCLFNLALVGGTFLYLDDKNVNARAVVAYASVIFAFLQFIGIVTYHSFCALKSFRKSLLKRYRNLDDRASAVVMPTTTTVGMDMDEPSSIADQQSSRYESMLDREPLLNTGSSVAMSDAIADTY